LQTSLDSPAIAEQNASIARPGGAEQTTKSRISSQDGPVSKRFLWSAFKYGLGIVLLAYVVWANRKGLAEVWGQPIHYGPFVLAACIGVAAVLLTFVRWYILVRAQDLPFTLANALRLGLIGYFLSTFLPGSIGGDIIKAAFIAKEQSRRTVAVATVLIDRAIGLWGLIWLVALLGGVFWVGGFLEGTAEKALQSIVLAAAGILALSVVTWVLLGWLPEWRAQRFARRLTRIPKIGHSLAEFWRAVWMYRCRQKSVALALLLALVGHVGFVLNYYFASRTLYDAEQIPSLAEHFLVVPIGMAVQAGFPAPGGIGGGEAVFGALYALVDFEYAKGVLMSLVYRVITWMLGFAGYLVYLRMKPALTARADASTAGDDNGNA